MFEHVYLGPKTREEHDRARETVTRIFDHLADRGDAPARIVDYLSGMTDRFALEFAAGIPE
jgi:dGTP triphosphohydrolase